MNAVTIVWPHLWTKLEYGSLCTRDWSPKFETGLSIIIKWPSFPFAKTIPLWQLGHSDTFWICLLWCPVSNFGDQSLVAVLSMPVYLSKQNLEGACYFCNVFKNEQRAWSKKLQMNIALSKKARDVSGWFLEYLSLMDPNVW